MWNEGRMLCESGKTAGNCVQTLEKEQVSPTSNTEKNPHNKLGWVLLEVKTIAGKE